MMSINDGGPYHACEVRLTSGGELLGAQTGNAQGIHTGASLRDHFAGLAMQGMYANPGFTLVEDPAITVEDQIAEFAYKQADAMLAERERGR